MKKIVTLFILLQVMVVPVFSQIEIENFKQDLYQLGDAYYPLNRIANSAYSTESSIISNTGSDRSNSIFIESFSRLSEITNQSIDFSVDAFSGIFSLEAKAKYFYNSRNITESNTIYYAIYVTREYTPERAQAIKLNNVGQQIKTSTSSLDDFYSLAGEYIIYQIQRRISIGYIYQIHMLNTESLKKAQTLISTRVSYGNVTGEGSFNLTEELSKIDKTVKIDVRTFQIGVNAKEKSISLATTVDLKKAMGLINDVISTFDYSNAIPQRIWVKKIDRISPDGYILLSREDELFIDELAKLKEINRLYYRYKVALSILNDLSSTTNNIVVLEKNILLIETYLNKLLEYKNSKSASRPIEPKISLDFLKEMIYLSAFQAGPLVDYRWRKGSGARDGTPNEIFDAKWEAYPILQIDNTIGLQLIDKIILMNNDTLVKQLNGAEFAKLSDANGRISFQTVLAENNLPDMKNRIKEFPGGNAGESRPTVNRFTVVGLYTWGGNKKILPGVETVFKRIEETRNYTLIIQLVDGSSIKLNLGNGISPRIRNSI